LPSHGTEKPDQTPKSCWLAKGSGYNWRVSCALVHLDGSGRVPDRRSETRSESAMMSDGRPSGGDDESNRNTWPIESRSTMQSRAWVATSLTLAAMLLSASGPSVARAGQEDEAPPPRNEARLGLRAGRLSPGMVVDGRLDEPAWAADPDSITNFTMLEPEEGGVPTCPTVVKVLADGTAIVIGVRCCVARIRAAGPAQSSTTRSIRRAAPVCSPTFRSSTSASA